MSIQLVGWVLDHSTTTGSDRLVLLALANHCSNTEAPAWPSYETIAKEARVHRSTAIECVKRLEEQGHITVERVEKPGRRAVNKYWINWSGNPTLSEKRVGSAAERVGSSPEKGPEIRPEPTTNRNEPRGRFAQGRQTPTPGPVTVDHYNDPNRCRDHGYVEGYCCDKKGLVA